MKSRLDKPSSKESSRDDAVVRSYAWHVSDKLAALERSHYDVGSKHVLGNGDCTRPAAPTHRRQRLRTLQKQLFVAQATPEEAAIIEARIAKVRSTPSGTIWDNPFDEKGDEPTGEMYGDINGLFDQPTEAELANWTPRYESTDPSENAAAAALVDRYQRVFDPVLPSEGARVSRLRLTVDSEKMNLLKSIAPRRLVGDRLEFAEKQIAEWLELKAIRQTTNRVRTICPLHVARKPTTMVDGVAVKGALRLCLDFKASGLNAATQSEAWAMPLADDILARMAGMTYFAIFDARSGFTQVRVEQQSVGLTAFSLAGRVYECLRVPFGLKNAPAHFQRCMSAEVLHGLVGVILEVFIDDIVVYANTHEELLQNVESLLQRCDAHRVRLKAPKCSIGASEVPLLGHVVNGQGIRLSDDRKQGIQAILPPPSLTKLRTFLGTANYFHKFIPDYARLAKPLTAACSTLRKYALDDEMRVAFGLIKQAILAAPVLRHIRDDREIILRTDASEDGCGGYLFQWSDDGLSEEVVQYVSKPFNSTEARWSTIEQEAYGVFFCVIRLEHMLLGRKFTIETDHANLLYMDIAKAPKVIRWRLRLQEFDYQVRHIAGKLNVVADGMSRLLMFRTSNLLVMNRWPDRPRDLASVLPPSWSQTNKVQKTGKHKGRSTKVFTDDTGTVYSSGDACWKEMVRRGLHHPAVAAPPVAGPPIAPAPLEPWQVEDAERRKAIASVHDDVRGHMGIYETVRRLRQADLCWEGQAREVAKFIKSCPSCQKTNVNRKVPPRAQSALEPEYPGHILCCDLIGPIRDSDNNKRYISVMLDGFARHVELESLASKRSDVVADALLRYCARYGVPKYIRTDGGGEYTAAIISDLMVMLGSARSLVLPYLSRANGTVERVNKEVMRHLRHLVINRRDTGRWDHYLPMAQRIVNATINSATGYAPSQIMFGASFDLNRAFLAGGPMPPPASEWMASVEASRAEIIRLGALATARAIHRRQQHQPATSGFESGEFVLMSYPKGTKPKGKLGPTWRGPYEILKPLGSNTYEVKHCSSGQEMKISDSRLVVYDASATSDLREIAALDDDEWVVDHIVEHVFDPPLQQGANIATAVARRKLQFLVRWYGCDVSEDSWISFRGNTELAAITSYCEDHPELKL
jgi:hypothetical protein